MKKGELELILVFEPWNFGDLIIATGFAKELKRAGYRVAVAYNPNWDDWIRNVHEIDLFYPIKIPWTARKFRDKYSLSKYGKFFFESFAELKRIVNPDAIIDIRGDIRLIFFLRLFFPFKRIISLKRLKTHNVYSKLSILLNKLNIKNQPEILPPSFTSHKQERNKVIFFGGASDFNRELPFKKSQEIVKMLSNLNIEFLLILKPGDKTDIWEDFFASLKNKYFNFIQGNLNEISNYLEQSDIVISSDSGWLHLGYFYKKKIIGLFAFNTINEWAPPETICLKIENVLPAEFRYKKKFSNIQPLANLNAELLYQELLNVIN